MWLALGAAGECGLLHVLAVACFTLVPTSCAVERQIKENSLIHTPERNCLKIESLSAQLLVRYATTRGLFQPWRRPDPLTRKRKKLTAAAKNAKTARLAEGVQPELTVSKEATDDGSDSEGEALAAQAVSAALEEQAAQEAAENVADWNEQEGRDVLLQLVASVPGAPPEPLLLSAPRDLLPTRRSARSTAGKDSRDRFE
jgi:hypothetical protein